MTYTPDIRAYQQLLYGGPTGPYDCTAWSGAILVDAHTQGAIKTTGRAIRLNTDEAVPDGSSPGLNLPQVDEAVLKITTSRGRAVDLDTRVQGRSLTRAEAQFRIVDGRWATVQVLRSVLVNRGFLDGFRGGHALTVHALDVPVIGDPLVAHYVRASWDVIWDAAEALTGGYIYAQFTRDLTLDYRWVLAPKPPATVRVFNHFIVKDGRIARIEKATTRGTHVKCTVPRYVRGKAGAPAYWSRYLVQLVAPGHARDGWYVDARWAEELNP